MAPRQRTQVTRRRSNTPATDDEPVESTMVPLTNGTKGTTSAGKMTMLNQTEADVARDWHDYFNLIALPVIVAVTMLNYDVSLSRLTFSFTGSYFYLMWSCTLLYFMIDLLWVARVPICVKSPGVIIKHHIAAMFYLLGPIIWPEYQSFVGSILSVEINTFFLIARRVVFKASSPVPPALQQFITIMFFFTWLWIRCYVYPDILVTFLQMAVVRVKETQVWFHWEMIFIVAHAVLCVLNVKWTYDLFRPIVRRWLGYEKTVTIQNGL